MSSTRKKQSDPFDVDLEEKTRRRAGQDLREKFLNRSFYVAMIAGAVFGLVIAMLLFFIVVLLLGLTLEFSWILLSLALAGMVVIVAMTYAKGSWSARNLLKGMIGEATVADVIERSMLQAFGCFIVNDVTLDDTLGNIDHIVVTPRSVLVVETKFGRVPPKYFSRTLGQISENVEKMQDRLGSEIEVQGCLVFADPKTKFNQPFRAPDGRKILGFKPETLKEFLFQECRKPRTLDSETLRKVASIGWDVRD